MIHIPNQQTKRLVQSNRSNVLGDLWSTFNIDLQSNLGVVRLGNKLKLNSSSASVSNLGRPVAFQYFDNVLWALCDTRVFKSNDTTGLLTTPFTEDASSGAVTTYDAEFSDMTTAFGTLVTTAKTKVYSKAANGLNTGAWTERGTLTNFKVHKLNYFQKRDRLYVTDTGSTIFSFKNDWTLASSGDYTIDLTAYNGTISTIKSNSDRIWIGMVNIQTSINYNGIKQASVFEWDGLSSQVTKEYKIDGAEGIMAIEIIGDSPVVLDNHGILRRFNGGGFYEIGRLPFGRSIPFRSNTETSVRWVHPNGLIASKDNTILVLVSNLNGDNASSFSASTNENIAAGIWEWSEDNGFVHKHSISLMPIASSTITDFGQNKLIFPGALANANIYTESSGGVGSLICGALYFANATTSAAGIFVDAPYPTSNVTNPEGQKAGYFVTTKIHSQNIQDAWQKLYVKYRRLLDSSDKIILKYRTREIDPITITITWVNTTSFTTTTDVSAYVGYEVEILQATGSGRCVHISSVTGSGTYTVTVDEAVTGVTTGTSKARLQKWTKILPTISNQTKDFERLSIEQTSNWIQFKCYMLFTGDDEIEELLLTNKSPAPSTQL